jgi:hypothetical protein
MEHLQGNSVITVQLGDRRNKDGGGLTTKLQIENYTCPPPFAKQAELLLLLLFYGLFHRKIIALWLP